ncbi:hypothetical protein CON64_09755 [Bacillus pseudomycoides]|nr:hypothetical protein CON64_09755 [Bacillus pseudomycoides]
MTLTLFCYECGEVIGSYNFDERSEILINGVECEFCGTKKRFKDCYYPHFSVKDFINTIEKMYEQNQSDFTQAIISSYEIFNINNSTKRSLSIEEYEKIYHSLDKLLEIEENYSIDVKSKAYDDLEDRLVKVYPTDIAVSIVSSLPVIKTPYRKPLVILIASTIELLFNIYFEEVCKIIGFPDENLLSIPSKIKYLDSSRSKSLQQYMKKYDENFYLLWSKLRTKRNKIIHKNSLYISNNMIEDYMKLLKLSIIIFMNITSELYREQYKSKRS